MRTIEINDKESLTFEYRENKDVLKENSTPVTVKIDMTKLSAEDLLEWAFGQMIVSFQSKLRSKNPPKKAIKVMPAVNEDGSAILNEDGTPKTVTEEQDYYEWTVPSRGTRSVTDSTKVTEQADKLVKKMTVAQKYLLMVQMGVAKEIAAAATGYTVPTPNAPAN